MKLLEQPPVPRSRAIKLPKQTLRSSMAKLQWLGLQRKRLLKIRANLVHQIKRLAEEACEETPGHGLHMADAATDSIDRDVTLGLVSFEQELLYEVDAALRRLDEKTYGICELTGKPIPQDRLEAIPWARFSVAAEAKLAAGRHPHIGTLRTIRPDPESSASFTFTPEATLPPQGNGWQGDEQRSTR